MTIALLAANDGGHIMQLRELADRFGLETERCWVTVRTPQTESLLAGERVEWVAPAPTRDWRAVARNAVALTRVFRRDRIGCAVSTGSSVALSTLPQAALRRVPAHYIESVTRTDGFSLSGRLLRRVPGVALYTQWPHLATGPWQYRGSVLDGFTAEPARDPLAGTDVGAVRRIVVSVGTSGTYAFRRLLERLVDIVPDGVEVLWQTGSTDVSDLPIDARASVPGDAFTDAIRAADVLVAHAGAGIALTALGAGKIPVLVPRRASFGEHVDDHQGEIAGQLAERRLAIVADAGELTWQDIIAATAVRARRASDVSPFVLGSR